MPKQISDPVYDEISSVDIPAAADARIALAKRHQEATVPQEDVQPDRIFDAEGNEITDRSVLAVGDIIFDADAEAWEYEGPGDGADDQVADEGAELEVAGVSKAFQGRPSTLSKSLTETLREELSKAATAEAREEVYKRALGQAQEAAAEALTIAKRQEDHRLNAEYTEIAKSYNVPEKAEVLGPILKRMAENLPEADCAVIHKLFTGVGEILVTELGYTGGGEADPYQRLEAMLGEQVSKSDGKVSKAAATESYFDADPREYDAYLASQA